MAGEDGYVYVTYKYPPGYKGNSGSTQIEVPYADLIGTSYRIVIPVISGYESDTSELTGTYKRNPQRYIVIYSESPKESSGDRDPNSDADTTYNTNKTPKPVAPKLNDTYGTGCYFLRYESGVLQGTYALPVYPQEFSDTNEIAYSPTEILGRSVAYQTYNHSSRSVSFSLQLHEEIIHRFALSDTNTAGSYNATDGRDYTYVPSLVAAIQSACYPGYNEGIVNPPEVAFIVGKQFYIRGILTNCGTNWKPPIIDGHYTCCDLSISVTETTGPYSASDIIKLGGYRGN